LFIEIVICLYININVGIIIIEYINKYMIENEGLLIDINLVIQPIWVIDEKAMIDFNLVWFIPITDPIMALIMGIIKESLDSGIINVRIVSGANFCQVERIVHDIQEIDVITDGNHMWHGAIPSLINIDKNSRNIMVGLVLELYHHIHVDIIRNRDEPMAWIRKYLSIASDSWYLFDALIRGINASMLISRAAHISIILFLEIAINDLIMVRLYKRKFDDDKCIDIKM